MASPAPRARRCHAEARRRAAPCLRSPSTAASRTLCRLSTWHSCTSSGPRHSRTATDCAGHCDRLRGGAGLRVPGPGLARDALGGPRAPPARPPLARHEPRRLPGGRRRGVFYVARAARVGRRRRVSPPCCRLLFSDFSVFLGARALAHVHVCNKYRHTLVSYRTLAHSAGRVFAATRCAGPNGTKVAEL